MKFLRFGPPGEERPGVLDRNGRIRDLSDMMSDLEGPNLARLGRIDPEALPQVGGTPRLGVPVAKVGTVLRIGLNDVDHAAEAGFAPPDRPILSLKAPAALAGPNDPIVLPPGTGRTGWEIALGVVIGRTARTVDESEALSHVAGYTIFNDLSDHAPEPAGPDEGAGGGSCNGSGPVGPWLVTPDEVGDPQDLTMELTVNGERMQTGSTERMIFPVARLVSYLSGLRTLEPGDIIATGTPPGIGMRRRPPQYLRPGDVVEAAIEGLGRQRQIAVGGDV